MYVKEWQNFASIKLIPISQFQVMLHLGVEIGIDN